MKFYVRVWGRPMGAEPKVFTSLEEAEVKCDCPVDPDLDMYGCSPWCVPDVREFNTEFEAWRWIKEMYPMAYAERGDHSV